MTYLRRAYDDPDSTAVMLADCVAVRDHGAVPGTIAATPSSAAPSLEYAAYSPAKPEITVTEAAARLAAALHLHLD